MVQHDGTIIRGAAQYVEGVADIMAEIPAPVVAVLKCGSIDHKKNQHAESDEKMVFLHVFQYSMAKEHAQSANGNIGGLRLSLSQNRPLQLR